jgi:ATP-dependent helicase HrpB
MTSLPIEDVIAPIRAALVAGARLVIAAPPGAGKTTRVPLALLDSPWTEQGRLLLIEPRRIAARAAAERMATTLQERVGETVGLRARMDVRVGPRTRIEVLTEGVFTRQILSDPELNGVAGVIFDEFHERNLEADVGLALALDAQAALRPDLRLIVMSATLDTARVSQHLGCPVIESAGRAFPVETVYLGRTRDAPPEADVVRGVRKALAEADGSILAFLPGAAEINRAQRRLEEAGLPPDVTVTPLYGALDPATQDRAIRPAPPGTRKVVLATDIAESALTIDGVRVVVDAGLARVPRHDPASGLSRLVTERASRASLDQRRGRAGRTAPGVCYRLFDEAELRGLPAAPRAEILESDLTGLALDLAVWGAEAEALSWLDPPPKPVLEAGRATLRGLGALTADGRLTERGRAVARLPLPPRLAGMLLDAAADSEAGGELAARLAVLLSERGLGGRSINLAERLTGWDRDRGQRADAARGLARRWAKEAQRALPRAPARGAEVPSVGAVLAVGFTDRIARRRGAAKPGLPTAYLTAGGRGVAVPPDDPLATEEWLVVAEMTGGGADLRVGDAAALSPEEARAALPEQAVELASYDPYSGTVQARRVVRLGAITLSETPLARPTGATRTAALLEAVRVHGWKVFEAREALLGLAARAAFVIELEGVTGVEALFALKPERLTERPEDWLTDVLTRFDRVADIPGGELVEAALGLLPYAARQLLDSLAPRFWTAPTGRQVTLDYAAELPPVAEIKAQELFGLDRHPTVAGGRVPIMLALLSPAQRPVAMTRDLPRFWRAGYLDMRKDMRGRYPKHDWPEEPWLAAAQTGAKRRPPG